MITSMQQIMELESYKTLEFFGTRAIVSIIAGLIIGIERTMSSHPAGIKTLVFVSLGSCMFATLSFYLHVMYPATDPTRILGQIITGIGFLGAGVIFHQNSIKVSGLTSASIIWVACSLGIIAGSGLFLVPIFAAGTIVLITYLLRRLERAIEPKDDTTKE